MPIRSSYQTYSDEELMRLVSKRDSYAFELLYDKYSEPLLNYFYRMLWEDREKAEDFLQDLFAKIAEKPKLFNTNRNFKTWLYSVANNMCKNEYRKQEVRKGTNNSLDEGMQVKDKNIDQSKSTDFSIFNEQLQTELNKLDENQKSTFVMRYVEDLSIKEIAKAMGCSEGTVKSRLFYTLKKLADKLQHFNPKLASIIIGLMIL